MKRPDFHAGIHPQLDCDIVNQRKDAYMRKLEDRLHVDCAGCPGCSTGDCADALDIAADQIAALAKEVTRLKQCLHRGERL